MVPVAALASLLGARQDFTHCGRPSSLSECQGGEDLGEHLAGPGPAMEPLHHLLGQPGPFSPGVCWFVHLHSQAGPIPNPCAQGTDTRSPSTELELPWSFPFTPGLLFHI